MSTLVDVDAVRAQISQLEAEIGRLETARDRLRRIETLWLEHIGEADAAEIIRPADTPPARTVPTLDDNEPPEPAPHGQDDPARGTSQPPAVDANAVGGATAEGRARRTAVLEHLRQHAGQWLPPGDVARALGETPTSLKRVWNALLDADLIEAKGTTAGRRYRVPAPAGTSSEPAKPEPAPSSGAINRPTGISGRERRQQRYEEAERQRREQLNRSPIPAGADSNGTIDGKVLEALMAVPATIPELAARMGLERADVAAAIARLEKSGDISRNGRKVGSGDILYRGELA